MGRKLGKKLDRLLTGIIVVVLLPVFITVAIRRMKLEDVIYGEQGFSVGTEAVGEGAEAADQKMNAGSWGTEAAGPADQGIGSTGPEAADQGTGSAGPGAADRGTKSTDRGSAPGNAGQGGDPGEKAGSAGQTDRQAGTDLLAETDGGAAHTENRADAEQKVAAILAREIRVDAGREAILAQSVVARTNLYDAWEKQTAEPEGLTEEEMQMIWGDAWEEILEEFEQYAALTEGEVLIWESDYIYAPYHALSAGMTRDITTLYEQTDMPYLRPVACVADATAEGSLSVTSQDTEEFIGMCREKFDEAEINDISEIAAISRDDAGYVVEMRVGSVTCTGEEFRSRLGLNSACYTITEQDGQVRVVTKGLGHGLGLSQHEAEHMAEEGADYRAILAYFYPGTEIGQASQ